MLKRETRRFLVPFVLLWGFLWPNVVVEERRPVAWKHFTFVNFGTTDKIAVNEEAYRFAIRYYFANKSWIRNTRYLTIIDYTQPSFKKRMYLIDLETGYVEKHFVAHGKNSGKLFATDFSNRINSLKSCTGFFLTGEDYTGKHGTALVLNGMQKGINDKARKRGIVIHGAKYVNFRSIVLNRGRLGRSWGCPAVSGDEVDEIVSKIKGGSLLYIYSGSRYASLTGRQ